MSVPRLSRVSAALVAGAWIGLGLAPAVSAAYNAKGRRDPFVPLLTAEGQRVHPPGLEEGMAAGVSGLVLQGIVFDPKGDCTAVINGKIVREGQEINGMSVVRIQLNAVEILAEGEKHRLELPRTGRETTKKKESP